MNASLERNVRERAKHRCEYCRLPSFVSEFTFPIDHIIARQHGGETTLDNLALCCPHCNFHKGPNIAGLDPVSRKLTPLFHPRRNRWGSHFAWAGPVIVARTAVGRTTLQVLAINHSDRVELRRLLIEAGVF
ncbi:HNH endonuclease [Tautonia rosea]|uniref:HNH endonuclease n=1 Tax=Tautonia rosea TaxID=2728037 RepID=UPI0014755D3C|nr:HNH endonuclease signature motif containing protein [Tautonia rosea]